MGRVFGNSEYRLNYRVTISIVNNVSNNPNPAHTTKQ